MGITLITQRATKSFRAERKAAGGRSRGGGGGTWTGRGSEVGGTTRRRKEQSNLGSQGDSGVRGWASPWGNGGTPKAGYQISDIKGSPGSQCVPQPPTHPRHKEDGGTSPWLHTGLWVPSFWAELALASPHLLPARLGEAVRAPAGWHPGLSLVMGQLPGGTLTPRLRIETCPWALYSEQPSLHFF